MSTAGIVLLVAVFGIVIFEAVSLIITIVKKRKQKKSITANADDILLNDEINSSKDDIE